MSGELNDTPIEAQLVEKKTYVKPQLHLLSGDGAEGKGLSDIVERGVTYAPS